MTQAQMDFTEAPTALDSTARLFREHRGEWVSALTVMASGGLLSWRTRVSECRTLLGMDIEWEGRTVNGKRHSYYRYKA